MVSGPKLAFLRDRRMIDYRSEREAGPIWLLTISGASDHLQGCDWTSVQTRTNRMATSIDGSGTRMAILDHERDA